MSRRRGVLGAGNGSGMHSSCWSWWMHSDCGALDHCYQLQNFPGNSGKESIHALHTAQRSSCSSLQPDTAMVQLFMFIAGLCEPQEGSMKQRCVWTIFQPARGFWPLLQLEAIFSQQQSSPWLKIRAAEVLSSPGGTVAVPALLLSCFHF